MPLKFACTYGRAASLKHITADVILLAVNSPLDEHPVFDVLDSHCSGALRNQVELDEFTPDAGNTLVHTLPKLEMSTGWKYVVLFGVGSGSNEDLRKGLSAAFQKAKALKCKLVAIGPIQMQPYDLLALGELIGEAFTVANRNPKTYKTEHSGYKAPTQFETLLVVGPRHHHSLLRQGILKGNQIGDAINFACDLASEPANIITPRAFAALACKVAEESDGRIAVNLVEQDELKMLNANGILMVSRGSSEPPFLIELTYTPRSGPTERQLTLIGKTVTFDTGGYNLKGEGGITDMKRDKTGGANVLAAIRALSALDVPLSVKAYFAATENMISGSAYRPGDVFPTMSGRTVEVADTDAEGRLTLVEAIERAQRNAATHIVDVATLTGAAKMVGGTAAPIAYGNDDEFSALVVKAAAEAHEQISLQRMLEETRKYNDSQIADIRNYAGTTNGAGSMTAAWFIREWVRPNVKWVHLDIANVAWKGGSATGHTVRTLIALARLMATPS